MVTKSTRARGFNLSDVSVGPVVDGGHADISSPSSSYQSASGLNLSTRSRTTRSLQQTPLTPVVPSLLTNVCHLSAPRLNGLNRNTSLTRPSQQHASGPPTPTSAQPSPAQNVSPPPAYVHHPPKSSLKRSTRNAQLSEPAPVSPPLPPVPDTSSPLTNAYDLPSLRPSRSTRTIGTRSTTLTPQPALVTTPVTSPPSSVQDVSSPPSIAQPSCLRGFPTTTQFSVDSGNVTQIAVSGSSNYADYVQIGSNGTLEADTSSSDSEDLTKPENLIDTEAMLKRLAASNPALAKLLSSGPRSSRHPQPRNGFVQDITGRMKKITEGSKYAWPEEKMPVKVNLVNRLTRKAKRTAEDEEGRRVPGFFHSVSFEEKWEVSEERGNFGENNSGIDP